MLAEKKHQNTISQKQEFTLLDSAVINLIVEKTKLNKEKYSLILTKTVVMFIVIVAIAMYINYINIIDKTILAIALIVGTLLMFVVYLYVIEHFNKMDRDIDEVVSLLQTKAFMRKR